MTSHFNNNGDLADLFLNIHYPRDWPRDLTYDGPCDAIDVDQLSDIAEKIQDLIANIISSLINAGSERDAVNESEHLRLALLKELADWTNKPSIKELEEAEKCPICNVGSLDTGAGFGKRDYDCDYCSFTISYPIELYTDYLDNLSKGD